MYTNLANANPVLNNISKLQIQQILKHPQIASVRTPKLTETYTYKVIVKSCHTHFYVLQNCK